MVRLPTHVLTAAGKSFDGEGRYCVRVYYARRDHAASPSDCYREFWFYA